MKNREIHLRPFAMAGLFFLLAYAFIAAIQPIWETDIWWHLRVGEWIVQNHHLPMTDFFSSIHPDREWRTFNWLFEVILYELHQTVGLLGIRIVIAAVIVTGYALWFRYFLLETKNILAAFALLALLLTLYADRIQVRPHVFNLSFEAMIALFLQSGGTLKTWSKRAGFFALGVLWANLHNPCAAVGAGVICAASVWHMFFASKHGQPFSKSWKEYAWPLGLSVLSIVCNPYGANLLLSGLNNIAPVYAMLGEWQPPLFFLKSAASPLGFLEATTPLIAFFILMGCFFVRYSRGTLLNEQNNHWLFHAAGPILFLAISQTSFRFVYLALPSLAWVMGECALNSKKARALLAAAMVGFLGMVIHYQTILHVGVPHITRNLKMNIWSGSHPKIAVNLIQEAHLTGKIFAPAGWGSYLLWFAHPAGGVSADGRNSMSLDVLQLQTEITKNIGVNGVAIAAALEKLHVDIAVLPTGAFPFSHWPAQWVRVARDVHAEVFLRADSDDLIKIKKHFGLSPQAKPQEVERAAAHFFGEPYFRIHAGMIQELEKTDSEESIHKLALIEWFNGREAFAIQRLSRHLKSVPSCMRAATELAEMLHDEGKINEAWQMLKPIQNIPNLPVPTRIIMQHLQTEHPILSSSN